MSWIRKTYRVPAKRGGRVKYTGGKQPQYGTIVDANGQYLVIRLDGEAHELSYHPTWEITYLEASNAE
ncbi:hypothetical protein OHI65_06920 [Brucella sp. MAB-22]|uniref:hypothetical protein n=1 Tax=Brucella sp. MAB-22 TaxID=2986424 RepID=UPI002220045D|nr:hypothetical protein [Brucella sp. MAB-22]UYT54105.1 hypothetical protein OHI65_06920 [Brucella sp. MAB-22]